MGRALLLMSGSSRYWVMSKRAASWAADETVKWLRDEHSSKHIQKSMGLPPVLAPRPPFRTELLGDILCIQSADRSSRDLLAWIPRAT